MNFWVSFPGCNLHALFLTQARSPPRRAAHLGGLTHSHGISTGAWQDPLPRRSMVGLAALRTRGMDVPMSSSVSASSFMKYGS